jgi:glyoxylase-like metal-dependent hydrolase (beta-lactamase superfamily II)
MGIRLRSLQLGCFDLDHELLVFPHPELGLNVDRRAGPKHWLRCPVLSYVIEHPDGLLLWDTGISPEWPSEWLDTWQILIDLSEITPEVCLLSRLKADGLGPEDFRYVVQSHLHADHAGGLRIFQSAGAEIIVQEAEYRHVESLREPQRFWVPADFDLLHEVKPPTLVAGDEELMRGVRLIHLPGHSPGSMALLVELDHTGWVALTGDALYTHESYGPPPVGSPMNPDPLGWAASVEKLRRIAREHEAFVLPGHSDTAIRQHHDRSVFTPAPTPGLVYE